MCVQRITRFTNTERQTRGILPNLSWAIFYELYEPKIDNIDCKNNIKILKKSEINYIAKQKKLS